jgi:hypothetical protein
MRRFGYLLAALACVSAVAATVVAAAQADPTKGDHLVTTCNNGFTGTLIGVPFTNVAASFTVSNSTSAFVIESLTVYTPDGSFLVSYQKPAQTNSSSTTCTFTDEELGFYGTLTGFFTPGR